MTDRDTLDLNLDAPCYSRAESIPSASDQHVASVLQGQNMQTFAGLFDEYSRALKFPGYFGRNFNALLDCLTDLAWLPARAYTLFFTDATLILSQESPDDTMALMQVLQESSSRWSRPVPRGEWWDRPAIPFHSVFQVTPERAEDFRQMLTAARVGFDDLSLRP